MNIRGSFVVGILSFLAIAGRIGSLAFMSLESARLAEQERSITMDINDPSIKARWIENTLMLEGTADSMEVKIRAEQIARAHLTAFHLHDLLVKPQVQNAIEIASHQTSSNEQVQIATDFE